MRLAEEGKEKDFVLIFKKASHSLEIMLFESEWGYFVASVFKKKNKCKNYKIFKK